VSQANAPVPVTVVACHLCGSSDLRLYHDQVWRRLVKCRDCRVVFADPLPTPAEKYETERQAYVGAALPETAEFFANCDRNFKEDAVIRVFRRTIEEIGRDRTPGRMLDVGPGTGIFLHLAREAGWEPRGIDVCQVAADKARDEFQIDIDVGEFQEFPYEKNSFDCITMLDVLEHSLDPLRFLERARELLRPGGILVIAVPNQRCLLTAILDRYIWLAGLGAQWFLERLYVSPHVFYFSPPVMRFALEEAGLDLVGLEGGNVYLGRYRLPLWMRVPLEIVLHAGSLLGMSARVLLVARKR
jgi:SAM-dependent methyltransferase